MQSQKDQKLQVTEYNYFKNIIICQFITMNRYFLTNPEAPLKENTKIQTHRSNIQMPKLSKSLNLSNMRQSADKLQQAKYNPQQIKLPFVKLKKVLSKIGAMTKRQITYIPPEEDQKAFRNKKIRELREFYPFETKKRSGEQFKFDLDQIVLDCYQHGQPHGKKTVWRKYRQNIDSLSFDTMKVLNKK